MRSRLNGLDTWKEGKGRVNEGGGSMKGEGQ